MLMKKLELHNFRQYIGDQSIEFSCDPHKNVTLILGKNTSGKTTLIQAFRWVLYNDCNFTGKKDDPKSVLNSDVKRMMRAGDTEEAKVTLYFTHQNMDYEVSRRYEYRSKISGDAYLSDQFPASLYYYPNGERKAVIGGFDTKRNEILPESLAEYFFFDGEKIAQSRNPDRVKDSINTIMGLVPLQHMAAHLAEGRTNVYNTLRSSLKSDPGIESINGKIDRVKRDIERDERNCNEAHNRYMDASNRAENLRVEMELIKDLANAAAELKTVDDELGKSNDRIAMIEKDITKSFAHAMTEAMENYISLDILNSLAGNNYEDKGIPGMTAAAIHYLLDNGKCICGNDLSTNESCRNELQELLTYLPPESIGAQITHLRTDLNRLASEDSKQELFKTYDNSFNQQLEHVEMLDARYQELEDKVKNHRDADKTMNEYVAAKKQRDLFQNDEVRYTSSLANLRKTLSAFESELNSAGAANSYNEDILNKIEYVIALRDKANRTYEQNSGGIFEEVQKTLTEVFNNMYHGSRTIEITSDYKVRLTVGGERLDNSKGLDTIQNFAFIASLLKVAKDRANMELNSEAYPLAMDAVFSNTDEGHIRNICKELPKLAEQAVLAIMEKDWAVAASSLEEYVGVKYSIKKISETQSIIEPTNGE
ncbi:AAA family ATPase [Candidatus Methanarcanum hacksteinii]|uniref:AAA family ATPase n=1 Tax=Candidatus Methanarcanum hacksteinii TaxID=2911857 RepID=UPI0037DC49E2